MKRSEIDNKYKWTLEDIYASNTDWELDFKKLQAMLPTLKSLKKGFTNSAQALADALSRIDEASLLCERLYVYAKMRRDEDNANTLYQAMTDRAMSLYVAVSGETSFVSPALLAQSEETLLSFISEEKALSPYAFMIKDTIRQKKHVLGESEERILSMSADFASGAQNIFTMLNNADIKLGSILTDEGEIKLTHGKFIELMQSTDRQVRKDTFKTYYEAFRGSINTIAAAYSTSVKKDVFYARVRGYENALSKALFADNVPVSLYDGLISCVHDNLDIMYDYIEIRKKLLGLDEIAMYDIYAPLVKDTGKKYSYEQAMDLTIDALSVMDNEYVMLLQRARNEGWIDVFENEGKTSGAYSWGPYGTHPYVLLNHRGDLDSVFTIAHELGHAMHSWYSSQNQPYPLASYTIFVAEVASTVNEILLTKYLLKTADEELKKYVLNHYLDQFRTTVLRQTMFAEFEKISHAMYESGQPLTHETLSKKYAELNKMYYGTSMKTCDAISLEWARIPHFYNAFYVYKYATGFSSAVMIATGIYEKKPGVLEAYKEFLKSGGSDYPLNLLKKAGVDFNGEAPVKNTMHEFKVALSNFKNTMNIE
ncbi:MAG: oligoendopeptidase F [Christensenellales bacterium]|jgi:oligoendopeptidase F